MTEECFPQENLKLSEKINKEELNEIAHQRPTKSDGRRKQSFSFISLTFSYNKLYATV